MGVSIVSRSRVSISTSSKSESRQRQKVSLDDRDFSISSRHQSWHQCPDQKVSIEIEKFVKIWKFWGFSTVCLDLDREVRGFLYFLVKISQSVKNFYHFQTQKASTMSRFLDKSWLRLDKSRKSWRVSTNLNNLNKNLDASKSRLKNLDFKNLNREKKKLISTAEKISTIQKSSSQHEGRSRSRSRLVSTVETPMLRISSKWICSIYDLNILWNE